MPNVNVSGDNNVVVTAGGDVILDPAAETLARLAGGVASTPRAPMPPSPFIRYLRERLAAEKSPHDLSRNAEFARFGYIAVHETAVSMEMVACVDADALTESEIVRLRDEFFDIVRRVPREFGLKPRMRNPNGLLCFVFSHGCSEQMAGFVAKQTAISHAAGTGALVVSWALDVPGARVRTHADLVSLFPPMYVAAGLVYPGVEYLQRLLADFARSPLAAEDESSSVRAREPEATPEGEPEREAVSKPEKVKILFLGANSLATPLDLELELKRIRDNLRLARERDDLELELKQEWAVTVDSLMQAMLDESPTIVHFSGHGTHDGIVLRDELGNAVPVPVDALARLFKLFRGTVRCVVLNACYSEAQARAIREHVPHVVGVSSAIKDAASLAFSTGFYKAIAAGKDVPFAFELGKVRIGLAGAPGEELLVLL
ncbi:MAG TPA: CHAT domain-containing protein [Longimicrobium sp.]|nr:CHAT domain-containing protein [Longimicrobium sp.]